MDRRHSAAFGLALIAFALVVFVTYRQQVAGSALTSVTVRTAEATAWLIELTGTEVTRRATRLTHPGGFEYDIYFRCVGALPVASLIVAIVAFPVGSAKRKLIGVAVGVPALLGLNLGRLVHLFRLGVDRPEGFRFAHTVVWESGIVAAVIVLWAVWLLWIRAEILRRRLPASPAPFVQ